MIRSTKTSTLLQESEDAFVRESPMLLRDHEGKWVAYQGMHRITVTDTKCNAHVECYDRGLTDDEFLVRCIEPPLEEIILGPQEQWG